MFHVLRNTFIGATVALTLCLSVIGASAATVTTNGSSTQGGGNTAGITFAVGYGANTPVGATWSVDPTWTPPNGNVGGQSQSPFNSNGLTNTQNYFTVGGTSVPEGGAPSPVTLTYGSAQSAFNILWGSIDSYNTIEFFIGASSVFTYTGTQLAALLASGSSGPNFEDVALVNFSNFENSGFDSVKFTSTLAAIEFALPAPIPLPAGGLLLLGALGSLTALRRRKAI